MTAASQRPDPGCGTFAVVGIDGSTGSQRALDWAVAHVETIGPVKPIAAFHVEPMADGIGLPALHQDLSQLMVENATANLVKSLETGQPDLLERSVVVRGYAGPALVRAAEGERLLVVGSRGRSALAETLLGSVTSYCVKHATVPIAVIPEATTVDSPLAHIVVGVDGSDNSAAALAWAMDHVAKDGRITVVTTWMPSTLAIELVPPTPEMGDGARKLAQRLINRVTGERQGSGHRTKQSFSIELETVMGDARNVLQQASARADLLVIGARGHRGAAYLLLGSVTTSLIHHPTAPTVVVPAPS